MRIFLMLLGGVICAGALLFWIFLNEMAAGFYTNNASRSYEWLTEEALLIFWLPFVVGAGIAFLGWKRR
ncbi:hypothetical protein [Pelagibius marinus]|uniref:hypothetical protein n=1 Tax=Pelagibius marinus TaxID=2762760 RepID=UPI0018733D20|nr:hypothetical protein [Pelagibius marinus]